MHSPDRQTSSEADKDAGCHPGRSIIKCLSHELAVSNNSLQHAVDMYDRRSRILTALRKILCLVLMERVSSGSKGSFLDAQRQKFYKGVDFRTVWRWWSVHRCGRPTSPVALLCNSSCSLLTLKRMNIQHQRHIPFDLSKHPGNMRMRAKTGLISWLDTTAQVPRKDPDITTEPQVGSTCPPRFSVMPIAASSQLP